MNLKTVAAAKVVAGNKLNRIDSMGAKMLLAADETLDHVETEMAVALTGIAANVLIEMIPSDFIALNAVADKLDVTDIIEATDVGADIAIAGAAGSLAMKFKKSYESLKEVDNMTSEEFEVFLRTRRGGKKETVAAQDAIILEAEALI